jgi:hypothetical protein
MRDTPVRALIAPSLVFSVIITAVDVAVRVDRQHLAHRCLQRPSAYLPALEVAKSPPAGAQPAR